MPKHKTEKKNIYYIYKIIINYNDLHITLCKFITL
jgi:hypothetical protein